MKERVVRAFSIADVTLLPAFILWFIWELQFTARWTWVIFIAWMVASFAVHRDTPETLGWTADKIGEATRRALVVFGAMAAGLVAIGAVLGRGAQVPPNLIQWHRLGGYFAFCVLQQVALNSLLHNRMMSLVRNEYVAAALTGVIFAACHWPNPVLVPLTFVAGGAMAWMFGRARNIVPLAIGQAILGSLVFWAFPLAWHHHMRVGPGYFTSWK